MNIVMIVISEDGLELWIQVRPVQETQALPSPCNISLSDVQHFGLSCNPKNARYNTSIADPQILWFDFCNFSLFSSLSEVVKNLVWKIISLVQILPLVMVFDVSDSKNKLKTCFPCLQRQVLLTGRSILTFFLNTQQSCVSLYIIIKKKKRV